MSTICSDYGMDNDEDVFCLANIPTFNAENERKTRELIRRAEEGRVDPRIRQIIAKSEAQSCGYLMRLLDDLLAATETSNGCTDASCLEGSGTPDTSFEYPNTDEAWPPTAESSYNQIRPYNSTNSSSSDVYPQSRTSTSDVSSANRPLHRNIGSEPRVPRKSAADTSTRRSSKTARTEVKSSNACCPAAHETSWSEQSVSEKKTGQKEERSDMSTDANADFNLENETPTELFKRLPPDTSEEDSSRNNGRSSNRKSRKS